MRTESVLKADQKDWDRARLCALVAEFQFWRDPQGKERLMLTVCPLYAGNYISYP